MWNHSTGSAARSKSQGPRSIRNSLVWLLGAALFLAAPVLRGQTTGEWQVRNSSGLSLAGTGTDVVAYICAGNPN
jgi:hypothetical protein